MSSSVLPVLPSRTRMPSATAPIPTLRSTKLLDRLRERIRPMPTACERRKSTSTDAGVVAFVAHLDMNRQMPASTRRPAWTVCVVRWQGCATAGLADHRGTAVPRAWTSAGARAPPCPPYPATSQRTRAGNRPPQRGARHGASRGNNSRANRSISRSNGWNCSMRSSMPASWKAAMRCATSS